MMKILCLLIILANVCVLLWEYRSGAFTQHKESHQQEIATGKESIMLWDEVKTQSIEQPNNIKPQAR
ncbi:MAG: hypothetical protein IPN42_00165 [Methylococcaceae bacterium]|nr:hypothetical protein [Methylococcaceae bacterium]